VATEPVIDLQKLLAPIPGDNPSGENQLYLGLHDQIREARRADDTLARGDWQIDTKTSDWHLVASLATDALAGKTKDLQVAAWLGEALIKLHGFAGLRDGLRLMKGLIEGFWETVYPEIEEGDLEGRANALSFMDRTAAQAALEAPITSNRFGDNYSYAKWDESRKYDIPLNADALAGEEAERVAGIRQRAQTEGKITSEQWRFAYNASNRAYYEETFALLNECWEDYRALDKAMDEKFANQTPGLGVLRKSLDGIRTQVEKYVKEKRILEPDPIEVQEGEAPAEGAAEGTGGGAGPLTGPLKSRKDALRKLAEVAQYFRQTEPHSPVSYLADRAIRWGEMPLDSWLEDVIKDPAVLSHLRETLGVVKKQE